MDNLKAMAVFAETVAAGSMSAAGRRLGMSASAVSQTIGALEAQSGITLLHRSTRKLTLTEAGARFVVHCRRLVEAARDAADTLQLARHDVTGELRVSAPVGFAEHVAPALAPLLTAVPQLRLRLLVDDAMIDLVDSRIDVALRVGSLVDSNWVARQLCDFQFILCAAPAYLERHAHPAAPQDLNAHQWLALELDAPLGRASGTPSAQPESVPPSTLREGAGATMRLALHTADGRHGHADVDARVVSNSQTALQQMCEHGLGIARFAHADVLPSLRRGLLVRVLDQWQLKALPVWALIPRRDGEEAKVRAALDHLRRYFATVGEEPLS